MGDGQQLDGAVANEAFPELWGALMQAVADYIGNAEAKATLVESNLSKERIYQATKQLRLNLTRFVNGIAQMQMTEISQQLQAALAILQNPQIVDLFGSGRQKNIQTVIERASKEWFDYRPNISAIRSLAVNGYGVFNWIARFDQTTVTDEQFNTFLVAAESWILAQAEAGGEAAVVTNSGDSDTKGSDNRSSTDSDDFDRDWSL
jgi:hypothetical protein